MSVESKHRWQFSWAPVPGAAPVLSWTRYEHQYALTEDLVEGSSGYRSTELQRLTNLGLHAVPNSDDYWRYLGPTRGWTISFTDDGKFILWDPEGGVELQGSAAETGAHPLALKAIADKVREDGEIVIFSGDLVMTDQGPEIQQTREAGNLLVGAAAFLETPA